MGRVGPSWPPTPAPSHPPYSRPGLCMPTHVPQPFLGPLTGAGGLRRADASRGLVFSTGPPLWLGMSPMWAEGAG